VVRAAPFLLFGCLIICCTSRGSYVCSFFAIRLVVAPRLTA
jgi:hypothetical protein